MTSLFTDSLARTAAVVAAPLIALIEFRLVFPADAHRRMTVLIGMMVRELQDLARAPDAGRHHQLWQARLYHRLLRRVRWSEKAGDGNPDMEEGGLAVYALGLTVLRLQRLRREENLPPGAVRAINAVLERMGSIATRPEPVVRNLTLVAARLERSGRPEGRLARSAAETLSRNLRFFGGDPRAEHDLADFHRSFPTGRDRGRVLTTEVYPLQDARNVGIACVAGPRATRR